MKKWDCWTGAEDRLKIIEKKNPLLSFLLCSIGGEEVPLLEKKECLFDPDCDVVFIDGVFDCQENVDSFLNSGKKIVFVEKDLQKIRSFLIHSDLIERNGIDIVSHLDEELKRIAWKYLYAKVQFIGEIPVLQKWLDGVHLSASDIHQNAVVARNIQANILRSHDFMNGKHLANKYKGCTAIVCGSGPSLNQEAMDQIREMEGFALVIAAGSSMPKLERNGIRIDFGVFVDPSPPLESYQKMTSFNFPLFYENRMCEKLFSLHKGQKIWMGLSGGWKIDQLLMESADIEPWEMDGGWNAGTTALQIAAFLGCNDVIMIGLDNGMKKDRELRKGEVLVEEMISRRDLVHAKNWTCEFVKKHPHMKFIMPDHGLTIDGVTRKNKWRDEVKRKPVVTGSLEKEELNFSKLAQTIGEINSQALSESLDSFLAVLKKGVDSEGFLREKILLEVELTESLLAEYLLNDLWSVTSHLFAREKDKVDVGVVDGEIKELILKATFFASAVKEVVCEETFLLSGLSQGISFCGMLEGEVRRSYPSGAVCSIEYYRMGKRHGKWLRLFESGDLMAEVNYTQGVLHGSFTLWGERGVKREGSYWYGKRDGRHRIFSRNGNLLFEGKFDKGSPTSQHDTYNTSGNLIEKLIYQTPKKFDRYCYNERGDLTYRGVFKGDIFEEIHFDHLGQKVNQRRGNWVEEALVWE